MKKTLQKKYVCLLLLLFVLVFPGCKIKGINPGEEEASAPRNVAESFNKAVKLSQGSFRQEAEDALKAVMEDYPLSPYALEAQLLLADFYYEEDRHEDAASYYASFITLHPTHSRSEYAAFQKGMSYFKQVLTIDRDQVATRKALFAFEDMLILYSDGPYSSKAQEMIVFLKERLAKREFYVGTYYYKNKNYKGALVRFKEVISNYPDSTLMDKTLYFIGLSYRKLGEENLADGVFKMLVDDYPDSPFTSGAKRKIKKREGEKKG